mmetsp:Transcript_62143/g.128866  ORF Transcript_62143/g.128866 Transcript_62143/m.128866 type:complete len:317 (+) Transcript_62143:2008-2958(+)
MPCCRSITLPSSSADCRNIVGVPPADVLRWTSYSTRPSSLIRCRRIGPAMSPRPSKRSGSGRCQRGCRTPPTVSRSPITTSMRSSSGMVCVRSNACTDLLFPESSASRRSRSASAAGRGIQCGSRYHPPSRRSCSTLYTFATVKARNARANCCSCWPPSPVIQCCLILLHRVSSRNVSMPSSTSGSIICMGILLHCRVRPTCPRAIIACESVVGVSDGSSPSIRQSCSCHGSVVPQSVRSHSYSCCNSFRTSPSSCCASLESKPIHSLARSVKIDASEIPPSLCPTWNGAEWWPVVSRQQFLWTLAHPFSTSWSCA